MWREFVRWHLVKRIGLLGVGPSHFSITDRKDRMSFISVSFNRVGDWTWGPGDRARSNVSGPSPVSKSLSINQFRRLTKY